MWYRIVFSILTAFAIASASAAVAGQPVVWTAPALSRIGRNDAPGTSRTITIHAEKGESESFQIAVRGPASHVDVAATDFERIGKRGFIDRSNVTLYREHYLVITKASSCPHPDEPCDNPPLGAGTYADALIPFRDPQTGAPLSGAELTAVPFSVAAEENQPIWIDVNVPRGAAAMVYPGENAGIPGGTAPSMRLKWLRDGVDDFDYIDLLKKAGCAGEALEVSRNVGRDWRTWTRDPARLEAARIRLGNALSRGADASRCASLRGRPVP